MSAKQQQELIQIKANLKKVRNDFKSLDDFPSDGDAMLDKIELVVDKIVVLLRETAILVEWRLSPPQSMYPSSAIVHQSR